MGTSSKPSTQEYTTLVKEELLDLINYDVAQIPPYQLPEITALDGSPLNSPQQWQQEVRPHLLQLFETYVYGKMLPTADMQVEVVETSTVALGGKATRIQTALKIAGIQINLVLFTPNHISQPVPCFLGMNFTGNHAAFTDPEILLSQAWMDSRYPGVMNYRATEEARGTKTSRWPVERILERGYALATFYYGDVEPDHIDALPDSPRAHFLTAKDNDQRAPDDAGAITAWAWALSRAMDYLETLPAIDRKRVCLTGHSRLGKTALWASANDPRFALTIANNSGCGGASPSRRKFGEVLYILSNVRPYWFCRNCMQQSQDIHHFPVDQHMLIALCAPRPVLISCAEDDHGADPQGEFESAQAASAVYQLLDTDGLTAQSRPPLNQLISSRIGYWIRPGEHDITPHDWEAHLDFADQHLR